MMSLVYTYVINSIGNNQEESETPFKSVKLKNDSKFSNAEHITDWNTLNP